MKTLAWVALCAAASWIAGCSCATATTTPDGGVDVGGRDGGGGADVGNDAFVGTDAFVGNDAFVATDACTPIADDPMRGTTCTTSGDCPTGYDCRTSFGTGMTCEISCTPTTAACLCPSGLACEVPAGMATGICS